MRRNQGHRWPHQRPDSAQTCLPQHSGSRLGTIVYARPLGNSLSRTESFVRAQLVRGRVNTRVELPEGARDTTFASEAHF